VTIDHEVILLVQQPQMYFEFSGVSTAHCLGLFAIDSTTTGVTDLRARLRRKRRQALLAAFLHAARNQQAPHRSISRLLSHS